MKNEKILILYDKDEEYAHLMCEYLMGCRNLPWKVTACTTEADLKMICDRVSPEVLVTTDSCYSGIVERMGAGKLVILNDSVRGRSAANVFRDELPGHGRVVIEKYQPAEETLRAILEIYAGDLTDDEELPLIPSAERARIIGVFSPIRRCYQTTFSILMGRLLRSKGKVLYLSFEFCEGCEELVPPDGAGNLSDLMYFIKSQPSVFSVRFRSMVRKLGELDYIPGAVSGTELQEIPEEEWRTFLKRICAIEDYSYVILDLSESIRGIFGILRMCDRVYTLTRNDRVAKRKLESYENILAMYEYSDVMEKSIRCSPPSVNRVPPFSGELQGGELIEYIRDQIGVI
ncbi:MAG: hypothetical protein ILP17_11140 [Lachnospiraceae bacterium]|nr:hypothetical protein [Lachnospiraceae bacterium]